MSDLASIKAAADIVDIIGDVLTLKRSGRNYTAFCPFHTNTKTPAFSVNSAKQTWHCYGECNEGGDVFDFVQKYHSIDFLTAVQMVADRINMNFETKKMKPAERIRKRTTITLLSLVADWFNQNLLHAPIGLAARGYCNQRNITDEMIKKFHLGYAPSSFDDCQKYAAKHGYTVSDLEAAGLVGTSQHGRKYDLFRNRLMFPIYHQSDVVGFGGRTLSNNENTPKYINSPETDVFKKHTLLYGYSKAKMSIHKEKSVFVVEGYMDVIRCHSNGYKNVVAPLGTAITDHQLKRLDKSVDEIIFALDGDAAGQNAIMRAAETAAVSLDRELSFNPKRLMVGATKSNLFVIPLPNGSDPDQLIQDNSWNDVIMKKKPLMTHVIDTLTDGLDFTDPKAKARAAKTAIQIINQLNPLEADHYYGQLANAFNTDKHTMKAYAERITNKRLFAGKQTHAPTDNNQIDIGNELMFVMSNPDMELAVNNLLNHVGILHYGEYDIDGLQNKIDFERGNFDENFISAVFGHDVRAIAIAITRQRIDKIKKTNDFNTLNQLYAGLDELEKKVPSTTIEHLVDGGIG